MRQAAEVRVRPGSAKATSTSLAAPIGGLNARDSIANMAATDAVLMENWFPKTTSVDVRAGYMAWNTFTGLAHTIMVYSGVTSTKVFVCVKNGSTYSIYDGTSAGALSSAVVGGGGATVEALTGAIFDYQSFGTTGGQYFVALNGLDTPVQYDGTTWIVSAMTGLTTANLFTAAVFKRRLWFAEKNSLNIWYLPVDSITGALTKLNIGPLFKLGGYINSIITVTDATEGNLEDYIGFLSSEGEISAFRGTDPGAAATWIQSAHFRVGRPVIKGNRTWCRVGSDAFILCADGVYPIRKAIQADSSSGWLAVSDKIRNLINGDIKQYSGSTGWQLMAHLSGAKLIVNVPSVLDTSSYQYVMNMQTGAWTKFINWNAFNFEVAGDTLYMGVNGKMVKADTTSADGTDPINFDCRQAYGYFNRRGQLKHMKLMRPIIGLDQGINLSIGVDTDYVSNFPAVSRAVSGGSGLDAWGGIWDVTWSGAVTVSKKWYGVTGSGHAIAPHIQGSTPGTVLSWSATDFIYEVGGAFT
jgi:hypothetical protein